MKDGVEFTVAKLISSIFAGAIVAIFMINLGWYVTATPPSVLLQFVLLISTLGVGVAFTVLLLFMIMVVVVIYHYDWLDDDAVDMFSEIISDLAEIKANNQNKLMPQLKNVVIQVMILSSVIMATSVGSVFMMPLLIICILVITTSLYSSSDPIGKALTVTTVRLKTDGNNDSPLFELMEKYNAKQ